MTSTDGTSNKLTGFSGVSNLRAPGIDPNYLDWEFKIELALEDLGISTALRPTPMKDWSPAWKNDNIKACTLISWAVDDVNIQYINPYKRDAAGMWASLQQAHKDSLLGGCLHLLQQLIKMCMETEDVNAHLQAMHKVSENLDWLVEDSNPLTPDYIFTSSPSNSLVSKK